MKRALQGLLIAGEEARDEVKNGSRKVTIREGHRDHTLGPVLIGCHLLDWAVKAEIISVTHTYLGNVSQQDLEDDGYKNVDEAIEDLSQWYPDIGLESPVTVLRWE